MLFGRVEQIGEARVVEAEHLVEVGQLDPDEIQVPSIFVKRVFQGGAYQKWIEKRTVRPA